MDSDKQWCSTRCVSYVLYNHFHSRVSCQDFIYYSVNNFGVHQKGEYGFCDISCSSMSSVKMKADEKTKESDHDPVVFKEELPIILNNPL